MMRDVLYINGGGVLIDVFFPVAETLFIERSVEEQGGRVNAGGKRGCRETPAWNAKRTVQGNPNFCVPSLSAT